MDTFLVCRLAVCLRTFIVWAICSCTMSVLGQSITWQDLPWPANQDWGGPQGAPATTNGNQIVLTGQDVLSVQSFTGPLTISYDVLLPTKSTTDGIFELFLVPTGENPNLLPNPDVELDMFETQSGQDGLQVQKNHGSNILWGPVSYAIQTQTTYHVSVGVAANGQVSWSINGLDVGLSNSVVVPYSSYQLRLSSWQPTQVWQVNNFTAVPEPTTLTLVAGGLMGLLFGVGCRKYS